MKGSGWFCFLVASLGAVVLSAPACGTQPDTEFYSCWWGRQERNRKDDQGNPDPCCESKPCCEYQGCDPDAGPDGDAGPDPQFCPPEQCIPGGPQSSWSPKPLLLWQGLPGEEPECPADLAVRDEWWGDLTSPPLDCPWCECDPPAGTCGAPQTLTAHTAMCYQPATDIPFSPLMTWDGSCNSDNPIAPCTGLGCVQSITIDALTLDESQGCEPRPVTIVPITDLQPSWGKAAVTCEKDVSNYLPCEDSTKTCAPTDEALPPGFEICIAQPGEHTCPDTHPTRYVFYKRMEDGRSCTECACDPPAGSLCTATISVYQDGVCSMPVLGGVSIDSSKAFCYDLPAGVALGSKELTPPVYHPGACLPAGGEPTGQVSPAEPITFCCLPPPTPPR